LISEMKRHLTTKKVEKIDEILKKMESSSSDPDLSRQLDDIISRECPLCGDAMINSIDTPFEKFDDLNSWKI